MCLICRNNAPAEVPPPTQSDGTDLLSNEARERGLDFLARHPTVDVHAHPGRFFMGAFGPKSPLSKRYPSPDPARAVDDMRAGALSCAVFATVADQIILDRSDDGMRARRDYLPGEAYLDHRRQLDVLDRLTAKPDLDLQQIETSLEIFDVHKSGRVGCIYSIEGGDFIEDRLERIDEAHAQGVRQITLIHYATNQIGDPQTESPVHGGLSPLGCDIVRAMNKTGIIVDLAHASEAACKAVMDVATVPAIISHSNIELSGAPHPRLISLDHARLVTRNGGIVGAVAAGFGQKAFSDFVETILRMIDALDIHHVAIGTDMDFTYRPVLASYRDWPVLAGALLLAGLKESEAALVLGGNFMRLLDRANQEAIK